jgi:hypothetical protein
VGHWPTVGLGCFGGFGGVWVESESGEGFEVAGGGGGGFVWGLCFF